MTKRSSCWNSRATKSGSSWFANYGVKFRGTMKRGVGFALGAEDANGRECRLHLQIWTQSKRRCPLLDALVTLHVCLCLQTSLSTKIKQCSEKRNG